MRRSELKSINQLNDWGVAVLDSISLSNRRGFTGMFRSSLGCLFFGSLHCLEGTFRHPILVGTFEASLFPSLVALWLYFDYIF